MKTGTLVTAPRVIRGAAGATVQTRLTYYNAERCAIGSVVLDPGEVAVTQGHFVTVEIVVTGLDGKPIVGEQHYID